MRQISKVGYCESCAENTRFGLVQTRFWLTPMRWFAGTFGIGPWYCEQCHARRWKLHKPLKSSAGESVDQTSVGSVSVGNFIRGESNLVMQSSRSSRYSEKFRAGIVQRVLDGTHSLAQISRELDVPQADILVWVGQQFARKQEQIEHLNRTIAQLSRVPDNRAKIETRFSLEPSADPGRSEKARDVIDGQVKPS